MNFKDHVTAGLFTSALCAGIAELANATPLESLTCGVIAFTFSLFPDVDTHSHISKILARCVVLVSLLLIITKNFFLSSVISTAYVWLKMGKHRGWTHSYFLPVVFFVFAYKYIEYTLYFSSLSLGLITHYIMDGMNPFSKKQWIDYSF